MNGVNALLWLEDWQWFHARRVVAGGARKHPPAKKPCLIRSNQFIAHRCPRDATEAAVGESVHRAHAGNIPDRRADFRRRDKPFPVRREHATAGSQAQGALQFTAFIPGREIHDLQPAIIREQRYTFPVSAELEMDAA